MTLTGLVGAMVVLADARSGLPRLPVQTASLLVTGGVTARDRGDRGLPARGSRTAVLTADVHVQ
ncbi:hypothetical protein OG389_16410 [Streptomyces sp. NBC_00435]|uniref:hypothetical protein n=1 Tax=Streptomyces sp. NBC_00435 TaxID=2903649 RepID=UPI002E1B9BD0